MNGMDTPEPRATTAADEVCISGGLRIPAEEARRNIRALAEAQGFTADALVEWASPASADLPTLYYAALLPPAWADDMPLGLGPTPAAALADLLWLLGESALFAALAADDGPDPADPDESREPMAASSAR
jgi:hypothetical protein